MKKTILTALFAVLITACGATPGTLTYSIEFDNENPDRMAALTLTLRHVVERRLPNLDANMIDYDVDYDKESKLATVSIEIDDARALDTLNEQLTAPINFEIRYLAEENQEGDIQVEGTGSFRSADITGEDVDWVLGETLSGPQKQGKVTIGFTDDGAAEMKAIFEEQNGGTIGIFVRNHVVAILKVNDEEFEKVIEIPGVPSGELAKVVADDINAGIHMQLTRVE